MNEFETAFETGDSDVELVDLPVETVDGGVAAGNGFGGEGGFPVADDEPFKAKDLPAGGGDVADYGFGNAVEGQVDGAELAEEPVVLGGIFARENGGFGFAL